MAYLARLLLPYKKLSSWCPRAVAPSRLKEAGRNAAVDSLPYRMIHLPKYSLTLLQDAIFADPKKKLGVPLSGLTMEDAQRRGFNFKTSKYEFVANSAENTDSLVRRDVFSVKAIKKREEAAAKKAKKEEEKKAKEEEKKANANAKAMLQEAKKQAMGKAAKPASSAATKEADKSNAKSTPAPVKATKSTAAGAGGGQRGRTAVKAAPSRPSATKRRRAYQSTKRRRAYQSGAKTKRARVDDEPLPDVHARLASSTTRRASFQSARDGVVLPKRTRGAKIDYSSFK